MNRREHLLTILAEECAEVAQRVSKALRFGLAEIEHGQPCSNAERIAREMDDLIGVWQLLVNERTIRSVDLMRVDVKKEKVARFLQYSRRCGTLTDGIESEGQS